VTERAKYLLLLGVILAALVGVAFMAVPGSPVERKPTLGLDLRGGLEVVLKAVPPGNRPPTNDGMNTAISTMRNRIDQLGVSEPEIRKQGRDQIVIQLAGVHDPNKAAQIIGTTAQLQFYDLEADVVGPSKKGTSVAASTSLYQLLTAVEGQAKHGKPTAYYLFNKRKQVIAGPEDTRAKLLNTPKLHGKMPKKATVLAVPANQTVISCAASTGCPGVASGQRAPTYYYLFKYFPERSSNPIPEATGKDLNNGAISAQIGTQPGQGNAFVQLGFKSEGNKKFRDITRREAERGAALAGLAGATGSDPNTIQRFAQHFAIVLDGKLRSTPYIDYKANPEGIDPTGTGAEISNMQSLSEAQNLALVLKSGALPYKFEPLEHTEVSSTLGKDSLNQAKLAAAIGLIVVALFLLLFYRFLGLIAVIGLAIYAGFLYAAILLFHVTLTLPGFAGMILTIGVAADANVVIFERIKEEVRSGKSVRAAIATGYSKGFATIIDANVVTCITALILFGVATAQVKGFALMLLIGTVISLVTAVAATRALLGLLGGFRWFDNPSFMGAAGAQGWKWLQIDFMGKRYLWFAISGAVILISAVSLGARGLNFGIDFKGGTQMTITTPTPNAISAVRTQASKVGQSDAVIQGRGTAVNGNYKSFQLRMRSLSTGPTGQQNTLTNDLKTSLHAQIQQVTTISSSFGRQIARSAILAIIVSLLLIVLYIWIRFQFKFAVPVIAALLHDIVITVGVYSLTGREVTTATVAAVLTVLGYSIYDTIIIFHRIKENIPLMRRASFATITNVSLWETIRRSLATTFITLLPVVALFLFGGATLKDFAFALIIGITSGAYSSIFIAAPLLTIWKEREPEYHRRKDSEALEAGVSGALVAEPAEAVPESGDGAAPEKPEEAELVTPAAPGDRSKADVRRERRRQRRRTRPHGRAR
jgi:SecD/SecF fusion protein